MIAKKLKSHKEFLELDAGIKNIEIISFLKNNFYRNINYVEKCTKELYDMGISQIFEVPKYRKHEFPLDIMKLGLSRCNGYEYLFREISNLILCQSCNEKDIDKIVKKNGYTKHLIEYYKTIKTGKYFPEYLYDCNLECNDPLIIKDLKKDEDGKRYVNLIKSYAEKIFGNEWKFWIQIDARNHEIIPRLILHIGDRTQ
jgi:hypothetical protein